MKYFIVFCLGFFIGALVLDIGKDAENGYWHFKTPPNMTDEPIEMSIRFIPDDPNKPVLTPVGVRIQVENEDGSLGPVLYEQGDGRGLVDACRSLARDPERVQGMGSEARRDYLDRYAPPIALARLEAIYAEVRCEDRPRGRSPAANRSPS